MRNLGSALRSIIVLCGLVACGDSTGADEIPNIGGNWTYSLTFSGGGLTCTYDPSPLSITQSGTTFTGRIDVPDATCVFEDEPPFSLGDFGNPVVNGTINAAGTVTFDFVSPEKGHHTGVASSTNMSGTMTAVDEDTGSQTTGTWTANR